MTIRDIVHRVLTSIGLDSFRVNIVADGVGIGGGTEYTEDAAAAANPAGSAVILVRDDALAGSLVSADGDNVAARGTNSGEMYVQDKSAVTALQIMDDWDESDRAKVNPIVGQAGVAAGSGVVGATTQRVVLATDVALPAGTNAIGKLAANSGVDIGDVDILSIAAGDNNIGNVDIVTMPNVTLAAGTNTNEVVGDVAHDAPVAGNPLLQGLEARSTAPTAVGNGDVVRALATLLGKQVVYPFALPGSSFSYVAASGGITDTSEVTLAAAAGAGVRNYLTRIDINNAAAAVTTEVVIKDGAGGTVIWRSSARQGGSQPMEYVFNPPLRGTANTALVAACITTASQTYINASGFVAAE